MQEDIKSIIFKGILAPSGENKQPWRFVLEGNKIFIFNLPERDGSLYNAGQIGSFVAHGCLIENMVIAASSHGYAASVELFPDKSKEHLVAILTLQENELREDSLYHFIQSRATNRKVYTKEPVTSEQKRELEESVRGVSGSTLVLVDDEQKKQDIAHAVSMNEKLLFENEDMHAFFFSHITWGNKEDQKKKMGLYVKTLELKPPQRIAFSIFKHWKILQKLNNKGGISKTVTRENAKVYAACAAFGAIIVPTRNDSDFVAAGRAMERVWLTATKMGLSLQLTTGILFLLHGYDSGILKRLSPTQGALVKKTYEEIKAVFGVNKEHIMLVFRLGRAEPPRACSVRLPPNIFIKGSAYVSKN